MAVIEERKNNKGEKSYRVKVRLKGFPLQTATFNRKTDAKHWAQQTEVAIREGRYFNYSASKRKLVNDLIDRYIVEILPRKSSKTIVTQTQQLKYWKEVIGHLRLEEVTPSVITSIRNDLSKGKICKKKKRTNATINRYVSVLLHAFNVVMKEWEWVHDNPCAKVSKLKESRGRTRYLSEEELKALLQACKSSDSKYLYSVVVMALSTGARKGEILSLRWSDVDFDREVIVIQESKNGEKRTVPLQGHALDILRSERKAALYPHKYIFWRRRVMRLLVFVLAGDTL